jgi:hypothetical protein
VTSYLATIAARELGNDRPAGSPAPDGHPGAVLPRHVGRFEPWTTSAPESVDRDALPEELTDGDPPARPVGRDADDLRAVTKRRGARDPVEPVRHALVPMNATPETDELAPWEPLAAAPPASVVRRDVGVARPPSVTPHALDLARTRAHDDEAPKTRRETPLRDPEPRPVRAERVAVPVMPAVAPVLRAAVPVDRATRRPDGPDVVARERAAIAAHDASPSVVVTIGRIEVRAVPAPAVPRPVRGAAPTMSLDDYLQERSRGLR